MIKKPWILGNQLLQAIELGNCAVAEEIFSNGFDVDSTLIDGKSAISVCVEKGCTEIAQLLIDRGCSLSLKSPRGESPLHLAVQKLNYGLVQMLLENRADVTIVDLLGRTALHIACEMNSLEIASLLIENSTLSGISIADRDGTTPLMAACKCGSIAMVRYFLSKGCKVNTMDVHGESPLLCAIYNNHCTAELLNLILDAGANVNQKNAACETALLKALHRSWHLRERALQAICLLLIDYGSDVNVKNLRGQTPLHLAVSSSTETVVRKLLNVGSDVEATDNMGFSPLFYACRRNAKKMLKLLIDSGADLQFQNWPLVDVDLYPLLIYVREKSKECPSLMSLCRIIIRKNLFKNVDQSAVLLPVPLCLIKYIQLEDSFTFVDHA